MVAKDQARCTCLDGYGRLKNEWSGNISKFRWKVERTHTREHGIRII